MDSQLDRKRAAFRVLREAMDVPAAQRERLVRERCAEDPRLLQDVFAMLADGDLPLIDGPASELASRLVESDEHDLIGQELGGWRVLALLGSGGMGTVYRVRREGDGFSRDGALKLVKRGMDSHGVLARFRRERHILARLEHPNIAGLFDGGMAPDGRPYLVMAHVDGEPLLDWAQRSGADLRQRLRLFVQLCDAVAHAHRQLIVHRDIKPANVLVDGNGDVRLLDFGIAKVLEADADAEQTVAAGAFLSRAYAAPEQHSGGAVTTATDIYQLGLLLFELLSGSRHSDTGDSAGGKVSLRLARARDRAGASGPERISAQQLRGDPGVIVARATDPDPTRRYGTVAALADDVRRYLDGMPIQARANSAGYRLGLFVARHRWAVALAMLAAIALLVTTALALLQAGRADREARLARAAQNFLVRVFDAAEPDAAAGAQVTARQLLDQGVAQIDAELGGQPALRSEMLLTMARLYRQLGQYEVAADLLGRDGPVSAWPARQRLLAALELATVQRQRERLAEAETALATAFGEASPDPAIASALLRERAHLREIQGRYDEALVDARAAVTIDRQRGEEGEPALIQSSQIEALVLTRMGDLTQALAVFDDAVARARTRLGEQDTLLGRLYNDQAAALLHAARPADAEAAARSALAIARARLDDDHPTIGQALQVLGGALRQQGRLDEAHETLVAALAIQRKVLGEHHGDIANSLNSLAILALTRQHNAEAESYLRQALAIQDALGQEQASPSIIMTSNLGTALMRQGRLDEAEPLLLDALARHRASLGEEHPAVFNSLHSLGQLALRQGRPSEAVAYARSALALGERLWDRSRETAIARSSLAAALLEDGQPRPALEAADQALRQFVETGVSEDARRLQLMLVQARAHALLGEAVAARDLAGQVLAASPSPSSERALALALLARLASSQGDHAGAERHRRQAREQVALLPTLDPVLRAQIERD